MAQTEYAVRLQHVTKTLALWWLTRMSRWACARAILALLGKTAAARRP